MHALSFSFLDIAALYDLSTLRRDFLASQISCFFVLNINNNNLMHVCVYIVHRAHIE